MQKNATIMDSIAVSEVDYELEKPVWEMEPSEVVLYIIYIYIEMGMTKLYICVCLHQYNFDDVEDNTIEDLDLPEIHSPHYLTTRIMLTVPQLVGNSHIYIHTPYLYI